MKINFRQSDDTKKYLRFVDGIYPIEYDNRTSWIWTTTTIYGTVNNIEYVTLKVYSEINNIICYDGANIEIEPNCLSIIKLNTTGKTEFTLKLEKTFNADGDTRDLGVKIVGILVDGQPIF